MLRIQSPSTPHHIWKGGELKKQLFGRWLIAGFFRPIGVSESQQSQQKHQGTRDSPIICFCHLSPQIVFSCPTAVQ